VQRCVHNSSTMESLRAGAWWRKEAQCSLSVLDAELARVDSRSSQLAYTTYVLSSGNNTGGPTFTAFRSYVRAGSCKGTHLLQLKAHGKRVSQTWSPCAHAEQALKRRAFPDALSFVQRDGAWILRTEQMISDCASSNAGCVTLAMRPPSSCRSEPI
jgi:hypothetical protein